MQISTKQAPAMLTDVLKAKLVPFLSGSPGIGKSDIIRSIAKEFNLKILDLRLSQCDPSDLLGFPTINDEHTKSGYVPMNTFPIKGDKIPKGKSGWILFLDEFNSAPLSVQAAAYKIVLDRQVGEFALHDNVAIVCAGNLATDKAITNRMSTAMQSRLIHLELQTDHKSWIEWAHNNKIDYRITSYIEFKPGNLHNFNPNHNDHTFPCPRTWEFTSKLISHWPELPVEKIAILAGTIGEGPAREFHTFVQIFDSLPKLSELLLNPTGVSMPTEPSIQYAITGLLIHNMDENNVDKLMQFLERLPIEFQIITLQGMLKRNKGLLSTQPVKLWIKNNSCELL